MDARIGSSDRDRAGKFARALRTYEKKEVPTDEIASRIKKDGGTEKLLKAASKAKKAEKIEATDSNGSSSFGSGSGIDEDLEKGGPETLVLETPPHRLKRAMGVKVKGQKVEIVAEFRGRLKENSYGLPKGFKRLKVVSLKRLPESQQD